MSRLPTGHDYTKSALADAETLPTAFFFFSVDFTLKAGEVELEETLRAKGQVCRLRGV